MVVSPALARLQAGSLPSHKTVAEKKSGCLMEGKGLLKVMLTRFWLVIQTGSPLLGRSPASAWGLEAGTESGAESSEPFGWSRCGKVSCELRPRCQRWMLWSDVWLGPARRSSGGQSSLFQVFIWPLRGEGRSLSSRCG